MCGLKCWSFRKIFSTQPATTGYPFFSLSSTPSNQCGKGNKREWLNHLKKKKRITRAAFLVHTHDHIFHFSHWLAFPLDRKQSLDWARAIVQRVGCFPCTWPIQVWSPSILHGSCTSSEWSHECRAMFRYWTQMVCSPPNKPKAWIPFSLIPSCLVNSHFRWQQIYSFNRDT